MTTTEHNITLTTHEVQLINSALSIYYSTRSYTNPLKQDADELKSKFLAIDNNLVEYDQS